MNGYKTAHKKRYGAMVKHKARWPRDESQPYYLPAMLF